jgi:thioredoxin-related protein
MLRTILLVILLLFTHPAYTVDTPSGLEVGLINPGFHEQPSWFKNSFLDLGEDIEEAAEEGKRIILYFYQDGCPYCAKLLNENFAIKEIVDKIREGFQLIAINIWGDRSVTGISGEETTEKSLAESLKVMYTPILLFLDEQGRRVLRINGYYPPGRFSAALDYAADRQELKQSFKAYLKKREPVVATGKLHREANYLTPPLDLRQSSRNSDKPLLVLMEMKQCPPCDELHLQGFRRSELRKTLQGFDVALVDIWLAEPVITPSGQTLRSTDWAESLGIQYAPSLLFFDQQGREVFRSEAYLKVFHIHTALDYVLSGSYRQQPNFQRFIQTRAAGMRARGEVVDLMK